MGANTRAPSPFLGRPFDLHGPGEIVGWSRILDDEEMVCILNAHGAASRGADILVDASLNPPSGAMTVVLNTKQAADAAGHASNHPIGSRLPVRRLADGTAYVEIRDVPPSEIIVLTNHPERDEGRIVS